jgi:hypothetical protein
LKRFFGHNLTRCVRRCPNLKTAVQLSANSL